jgi:hypothetical protein
MKIKVSKVKNYYKVKILTDLPYVAISGYDSMLHSNRQSAETFIVAIHGFKNEIEKQLTKYEFEYKVDAIIVCYLQSIDSYASGIDIRSKMKIEEVAERFVLGYHDKYTQALNFCNETLKYVSDNQDTSYMQNYRRYDEHNAYRRNFYLTVDEINMDSFKKNELKSIGELLDKMHAIIDKAKK